MILYIDRRDAEDAERRSLYKKISELCVFAVSQIRNMAMITNLLPKKEEDHALER
jgi:hypothetical protein